jgi:SAM-dependent methyltransferase
MIEFPRLPDGSVPRWIGAGFQVDDRVVPVLEYSHDEAGWDDSLTAMHEEEAGDGTHPIDVESRRKAIASLKEGGFPADGSLIEIGCSSGFLLQELHDAYPSAALIGADVVSQPLARLSRRHPDIPFIRMNLVECALPSDAFDAVVALNVLEHIEHDGIAVGQVFRILKPGGMFVVEVPQGPSLFDAYDRQLRHFRRYDPAGLRRLLFDAGFEIEYRSHLGFLIYPAFVVAKMLGRGRGAADEHERVTGQIRNSRESRLLSWSLRLDASIDHVARLPIGIRCVAIARKPRSN